MSDIIQNPRFSFCILVKFLWGAEFRERKRFFFEMAFYLKTKTQINLCTEFFNCFLLLLNLVSNMNGHLIHLFFFWFVSVFSFLKQVATFTEKRKKQTKFISSKFDIKWKINDWIFKSIVTEETKFPKKLIYFRKGISEADWMFTIFHWATEPLYENMSRKLNPNMKIFYDEAFSLLDYFLFLFCVIFHSIMMTTTSNG